MTEARRFDGRVALVTGASRGIGRAIALRLAEQGADVALVGRSSQALKEVEERVRALGRRGLALGADVSSGEDAKRVVDETLGALGRLDFLVNNAGITRDNLVLRMGREEWDQVLAVNLTGVYLLTQAALRPMLRARRGRIVNVTSVVGLSGNPGQANYAASKAGIVGFSKSVAREVARRGITVNAVAPGFVETDMTAGLPAEARERLLGSVPAGRAGTPDDVAQAVLFLLTDGAGYITGEVLRVDGGMAM